MNSPRAAVAWFCLLAFPVLLAGPADSATEMSVTIDARDLPRRLLHSETTLELSAGRHSLLYVKWVPGIHAPRGPIENVAGFAVRDSLGNEVPWVRDWSDPYRFYVDVPEAGRYLVSMTYITNQPSTNSKSVDSYGYADQGVINTNTVVVYPEGQASSSIEVNARVLLPDGWRHGSAMALEETRGDTLIFEPTTFEDFLDKPMIAGRHLETYELADTPQARWFLHVSADEAQFVPEEDDSLLVPIRSLCREAEALFGRTHFEEYHFLLSLSDHHGLGIEHRNSSLNSDKPDTFDDKPWLETGLETLLPHEIAHAWCGKYRRPVGMLTEDLQTPNDTELLWVYEGLDSYIDWVLTARAGFRTPEVMREALAYSAASLVHQRGRDWRPLSDTAVASWTLRGGSTHWSWLRRSQDYYTEGAFIWLEVDARIRELTGGKSTLDDFCAAFFGKGDPAAHAVPFDREEILVLLDSMAPYDWRSFFVERVDKAPGRELPRGLELAGWTLALVEDKPSLVAAVEKMRKESRYYDSLGLAVDKDAKIKSVVPTSPADSAGLIEGWEILGVNGRRFSSDRLEEAVRTSGETHGVELLVDVEGQLRTHTIRYGDGLRYYGLLRDEGQTDWLSDIFEPRTGRRSE